MEKFDQRYLEMAEIWARNSYCKRRQVGAILVKDRMIISDGYNGTPSGFENVCEDENGATKPYVLHAEANAIISAARSDTIDATIYLACHDAKTGELYGDVEPCAMCKRMIINAGISTVIIRNTHDKYTTINVQSWIEHDDSLEGTDGY